MGNKKMASAQKLLLKRYAPNFDDVIKFALLHFVQYSKLAVVLLSFGRRTFGLQII
jgi:hypothetical protein